MVLATIAISEFNTLYSMHKQHVITGGVGRIFFWVPQQVGVGVKNCEKKEKREDESQLRRILFYVIFR